jgi:hypothetical protein
MSAQDSPLDTAITAARPSRAGFFKPAGAVLVASALALVLAARAAEPEPPSATEPITFNIPAQPLSNALHTYSRRVGVQVLYDTRSAAGHQSVAVQGPLTPEEALRRLLGNTDLQVRHVGADAITLVAPIPVEQDVPPVEPLSGADLSLGELRVRAALQTSDLERFADYSDAVRTEIQRALQQNPHSATGNYRAVLDLWIDSTRRIRKAALLRPTGDELRDLAITTTLQGLTISRPTPAGAPLPIRVGVAVSTSK